MKKLDIYKMSDKERDRISKEMDEIWKRNHPDDFIPDVRCAGNFDWGELMEFYLEGQNKIIKEMEDKK